MTEPITVPVATPQDRRKLVAVLHADMVGYSRLIGSHRIRSSIVPGWQTPVNAGLRPPLTAADGIDRGPPPSPFASDGSTAIFVPASFSPCARFTRIHAAIGMLKNLRKAGWEGWVH